jgi:hypothetical protein
VTGEIRQVTLDRKDSALKVSVALLGTGRRQDAFLDQS